MWSTRHRSWSSGLWGNCTGCLEECWRNSKCPQRRGGSRRSTWASGGGDGSWSAGSCPDSLPVWLGRSPETPQTGSSLALSHLWVPGEWTPSLQCGLRKTCSYRLKPKVTKMRRICSDLDFRFIPFLCHSFRSIYMCENYSSQQICQNIIININLVLSLSLYISNTHSQTLSLSSYVSLSCVCIYTHAHLYLSSWRTPHMVCFHICENENQGNEYHVRKTADQ